MAHEEIEIDTDAIQRRMDGAMAALKTEFASLRTGRAVSEGERDKLQQGELLALDAERTETLSRLVDHCRANDAALDGLFLGAQLDIDPEREVIRDNPAANDLLSREHRKGFELPSVTSAGPVGAAPR